MINSLRPLLADCPAVLQQKWHWDHLSMLPDNAHKCEICQTQYVNNHNYTGWGHVQANPTEMLLDDVGWAGFSLTNAFFRERVGEVEGLTWDQCAYWESVVHHQPNLCTLRPLALMFVINILSVLIEQIKETLLKTCRPCRGYWPE